MLLRVALDRHIVSHLTSLLSMARATKMQVSYACVVSSPGPENLPPELIGAYDQRPSSQTLKSCVANLTHTRDKTGSGASLLEPVV